MSTADLTGLNAGYVAQMLEAYLEAPTSVPVEWRELFERDPGVVAAALPGLAGLLGNGEPVGATTTPPPPVAAPPPPVVPDLRPRAAPAAAEPEPEPPPADSRAGCRSTRSRSTTRSSVESPPRWRSSRRTGCTATSLPNSIRSAPSRWATRPSTSRGSCRL